jgi:hypothetical protein
MTAANSPECSPTVLPGDGVIEARRIRKGAVTALICVIAAAFICIAYEFAARQHHHIVADHYDMAAWKAGPRTQPPPTPRFHIEITPLPQRPPQRPPVKIEATPPPPPPPSECPFPFDYKIFVGPRPRC